MATKRKLRVGDRVMVAPSSQMSAIDGTPYDGPVGVGTVRHFRRGGLWEQGVATVEFPGQPYSAAADGYWPMRSGHSQEDVMFTLCVEEHGRCGQFHTMRAHAIGAAKREAEKIVGAAADLRTYAATLKAQAS
jgi:hypothetical protein